MRHKFLIVVAVAIVGCLVSCRPSSGFEDRKPSVESPEQVVKSALAALKQDRMEDFAKMMHPAALRKFKDMMVSIAEGAAAVGQERQILALFGSVASTDELSELDERPLFLKFFQTINRSRPEVRQAMAGAEVQLLGTVNEGAELAHVLYRITMTVEGLKATKLEVLSLQRTEEGWAMLLRSDLETMALALKQRFARTKP